MLYYILLISILFNFIFITVDIFPVLKKFIIRKIEKVNTKKSDNNELIDQVIKKANKMAERKKVIMPVKEQSHFLSELHSFKIKWFKNKLNVNYYPKAFLFAGLTDYCISSNDSGLIEKVIHNFNRYINENGTPSFHFNEVDQVPFGIAAINLYRISGAVKYKYFADFVYAKLCLWSDKESKIIPYRRQNQRYYFNDALGMVCPFLVRYGFYFRQKEATILAYKQLNYFIKYGLDLKSDLPSHALSIETNFKLGPTNWGRGIGWYFIALSEYIKFSKDDTFLQNALKLVDSLNKLKTKDDTWSQFPGTSDKFDASATTLIMYSINNILKNCYTKNQIVNILRNHITCGIIDSTSGDTYNINYYSRTFGKSELSQGVLLMLLSEVK